MSYVHSCYSGLYRSGCQTGYVTFLQYEDMHERLLGEGISVDVMKAGVVGFKAVVGIGGESFGPDVVHHHVPHDYGCSRGTECLACELWNRQVVQLDLKQK